MPATQFSRKIQFANLNVLYEGQVPFSPSDTVDVPVGSGGNQTPCVGVYVGGAGNVSAQLPNGGTAVLTGIPADTIVDIAIKRILATGTTATGVIPLYGERA